MKSLKNISVHFALNFVIFFSLVTLFLATMVFNFFDERSELRDSQRLLREVKYSEIKRMLKHEVNTAIQLINFTRQNSNDSDSVIQDKLLNYFADVRLEMGGYLFINTIEGNALVFDGKRVRGVRWIGNMTDSEGNDLFGPQLAAFHNPEGQFMEYYFKPLGDIMSEQPKISFMKGYEPYGWIIGAGIYLPDLNQELAGLEKRILHTTIKENLITFIAILLLALLLYIFIRHIIRALELENYKLIDFLRSETPLEYELSPSEFRFRENRRMYIALRQIEEEKSLKEKQLEEQELRYKELLNQAGDAILLVNSEGDIIESNEYAVHLTGYSSDELSGLKVEHLFTSEELERVPFDQEGIEQGKVIIKERVLKNKNGSGIPVEMSSKKIGNGLILSIIRDISFRKEAEKELATYRDHLEDLVKARTIELEEKNRELERMNELFVGREFRIKELRDKVKMLEAKLREMNRQPPSDSQEGLKPE
ncbi:MAG: hypothetical protein Kow00127_23400 [Bacteroidales bacterium]